MRRGRTSKDALAGWKLAVGGVFLVGLLADLGLSVLVAREGIVNPGTRPALFTQAFTLYSPLIGTILGGILVLRQRQRVRGEQKEELPPAPETWQLIAVVLLALVWNFLQVGRLALLAFDWMPDDTFKQVTTFQSLVAGAGGIPMATGLAFLYGSGKS